MPARFVAVCLSAGLVALAGCVPELESTSVETSYPLSGFDGPETLPEAPEGTLQGLAMEGPWEIVDVQHEQGDATVEHLFQPGWVIVAGNASVATVQGVPPEWLLPRGLEWRLNRVDDAGIALAFGFATPRGRLSFLHYAFVAAPTADGRARALEAAHFKDAESGLISWSIWSLELRRVQQPPQIYPEIPQPAWPQ
jgi:hypothetical protein